MTRAGLTIASVAGVVALGTAGYFANEWRVCRNMEQAFVSQVEGFSLQLKNGALMGAIGIDPGITPAEREQLTKLHLQGQKLALESIYSRCGSEAGQSAAQRAQAILQDGMQDILSIP